MFGLEKEETKVQKFQFDLEIEIIESPAKAKELIDHSKEMTDKLKKAVREGGNEKDFDNYGILLHGYSALSRILKKLQK